MGSKDDSSCYSKPLVKANAGLQVFFIARCYNWWKCGACTYKASLLLWPSQTWNLQGDWIGLIFFEVLKERLDLKPQGSCLVSLHHGSSTASLLCAARSLGATNNETCSICPLGHASPMAGAAGFESCVACAAGRRRVFCRGRGWKVGSKKIQGRF